MAAAERVFSTTQGIKWSRKNMNHVPFPIKVLGHITSDTVAYDILRGKPAPGPTEVSAAAWFSDGWSCGETHGAGRLG